MALAINGYVIGDVNPSLPLLMVALVLAQTGSDLTVVIKKYC